MAKIGEIEIFLTQEAYTKESVGEIIEGLVKKLSTRRYSSVKVTM